MDYWREIRVRCRGHHLSQWHVVLHQCPPAFPQGYSVCRLKKETALFFFLEDMCQCSYTTHVDRLGVMWQVNKRSLCIYELNTYFYRACLWLQAVRLLKKGGVLVYSTCTVTLAENEEQVAWALDAFPCLTLQPQVKNTHTHRYVQWCKESSPKLLFLRSLTSALKACWEPACHLSSCASSRGSVLSWAGTRLTRRLPSPAEPTETL